LKKKTLQSSESPCAFAAICFTFSKKKPPLQNLSSTKLFFKKTPPKMMMVGTFLNNFNKIYFLKHFVFSFWLGSTCHGRPSCGKKYINDILIQLFL
jgi:hypothetical protein